MRIDLIGFPRNQAGRRHPIELSQLGPRPLVSILIPAFNYERFIPEAIRSALGQKYEHIEVIFCDDGSTDNSLQIAAQFARYDDRLRVITKRNGGHASALNAAYAASKGEIICLLDADDVFAPEKVSVLVEEYVRSTETGLLVHPMILIDQEGHRGESIPFLGRFEKGWIANKMIQRGGRWRFMSSSALSFRREAAQYCMPIPEENFRVNAETFIFTLLPFITCVGYVDSPLSFYRIHGSNMTGDFVISADTLRYWLDSLATPNQAVNHRLQQYGYSERLDLTRNLDAVMHTHKLEMLEGARLGRLLRLYWAMIRLLIQDDILLLSDKLLLATSHGLALVLHIRGRKWLFNKMSSPNSVKFWFQRILAKLRHSKADLYPQTDGNQRR